MTRLFLLPCTVLCLFASACGEEESTLGLFSTQEVEATVRSFHTAWMAGKSADVAALCASRFEYRGRVWETTAETQRNLVGPLADGRIKSSVGDTPTIDVFSFRTLRDGKNVPGFPLPRETADRSKALLAAGLSRTDGFVVRVYEAPKSGWLLVLGPDGASRLRVLRFL